MRPLKNRSFANSLILAVEDIITSYVDEGPPSENEFYVVFLNAALYGAFIIVWVCLHTDKTNEKYSTIPDHLDEAGKGKAEKLMIQYDCTSCAICLEHFEIGPDGY